MRIQINGEWKNIPSSLQEITLQQRIEFQEQHGNELDLMLESILKMEDEMERELELMQFKIEKAIRSLSFFLDCTIESLKESEFIDSLLNMYWNSINVLLEEENEIAESLEQEFVWNGEIWKIHSPILKNGDRLSFGEFIDSKQSIQDMINLGKNKWECLVTLCAVYLRKEDEVYDESFLYENSERLELMKTVPLNIAFQVGFFLSSSVSMLAKIFQSLDPHELKSRVGL